MSQMSGMAGDGGLNASPGSASPGRAVAILALAVAVGVVLLQGLEPVPSEDFASSEAVRTAPVSPAPITPVPVTRPPAEVKVLVANGVGVDGAASKVAGRIQPAGYQLMKPGNTVTRQEASGVFFAPGFQAEAEAVALSLGIPTAAVTPLPAQSPVTDLQASHVVVVVGNELANAPQTQAARPAPVLPQEPGQPGANPAQRPATVNPLDGPLTPGANAPATGPSPGVNAGTSDGAGIPANGAAASRTSTSTTASATSAPAKTGNPVPAPAPAR